MAEQQIGLSALDIRPVNSDSYRTGPGEHEFENTEIEPVLAMKARDPAQAE